MRFSIFQESRKGGREANEDRTSYAYTRDSLLMVVADGMGGHLHGEVASQIAAQLLTEAQSDRALQFARDWVRQEPQDPEALFCRMRALLRTAAQRTDIGDALGRALDDATAAVQRANERGPMVYRICRAWETAAAVALLDEHRAAMLVTVGAFKALP